MYLQRHPDVHSPNVHVGVRWAQQAQVEFKERARTHARVCLRQAKQVQPATSGAVSSVNRWSSKQILVESPGQQGGDPARPAWDVAGASR